jgi:phage N-6-adenine-methyltransferase
MGYHGSKTEEGQRDEYRTPPYLFRWANELIGGIMYDTACTNENALETPIWADEKTSDALSCIWISKCWCNPPYSECRRWIDYAIKQNAITAMLIPSNNGESYYKPLIESSHEISIIGRIAFIGADGKPKSGNNRGSSLFIINGYAKGSRSAISRDWIYQNYGEKNGN